MNLPRAAAAALLAASLALAGCQGDEEALSVVVGLPEQNVAGVAKATVLVDYSGSGARILTEGGGPACAFILPGVDGDFSDDGQGTLTIHTSGPRALRGPADIAACRMKAGDPEATAEDVRATLSVKVSAAEDSAGKAIDLASRTAKPRAAGGGAAAEKNAETAQAEAVKAAVAAAAAAPPRPPAPDDAVAAGGPAGGGMRPGAAPGVIPGPQASAPKPIPPRPVAGPGNLVRNPAAPGMGGPGNGQGNDPGVTPRNDDRDPDYDDSPSDDERAPAYNLEIWATGDAPRFGALQFEIRHLGSSGGFVGRGDKVDCVSLVEAITAANYKGQGQVTVGFISVAGVRLNIPIMRCGFRTREGLSPASFDVKVTDASDTNSKPLDPEPNVVISSVTPR
ncbi:MAG: hypothetical protein ABR538_16255 [Candidatus Binatia bacterium]